MNKRNAVAKRLLPDSDKKKIQEKVKDKNSTTLTVQQLTKAMFIDRCQIANTYLRETLLLSTFARQPENKKAYKNIIMAQALIVEASKTAGDITFSIETF